MTITPEERAKIRERAMLKGSLAYPSVNQTLLMLDAIEQLQRERDVLAEKLTNALVDCPGEWDECPFPEDCNTVEARCWLKWAAQQAQKSAEEKP